MSVITYGTSSYEATAGTLDAQITYKDASQTLTIKASSLRSAATNRPVSNLGNEVAIPTDIASSKTVTSTKTKTFSGYRCYFSGYRTASNKISDISTIDSTIVRNQSYFPTVGTSNPTSITTTGMQQIFIAVPYYF